MRCFLLGAALLVADVAGVEHFHFDLAKLRQHHRQRSGLASLGGGGGLPPELSEVLEESKRRLSIVEAQQEKAVEKARSGLGDALNKEAATLRSALLAEVQSLRNSSKTLESVAQSARAALSAEDPLKSSNGWNGTAVEASARLSAKISMLESFAKRSERKMKRLGEDAQRRAKAVLEDAVFPLNRQIGDLSPLLSEAEKRLSLDEAQEVTDVDGQASKGKTASASFLEKTTAQTVSAEVLEQAKQRATRQAAEAEKALAAALESSQKSLKSEVQSIKAALEAAEKEEMSTVHAGGAAAAKLKALASRHKMAAPVKK